MSLPRKRKPKKKRTPYQKSVDAEKAERAAKKLKQTTTIRKRTQAVIKKINKAESFPELHNIGREIDRIRLNKFEAAAIHKANKAQAKIIKKKVKIEAAAHRHSRREYRERQHKYISQWTVEERRGGLSMLANLAAAAQAKRYVIRNGERYTLVEMSDTKEFLIADAKEARKSGLYGRGSKIFVKSFSDLSGLYVHMKEKAKK